LIDLHEVPKCTGQTDENRNLEEKVVNLSIMQSPYRVCVFGEEYISSREYYGIFGFVAFASIAGNSPLVGHPINATDANDLQIQKHSSQSTSTDAGT
jgi:hypothetical protein